MAGIRVNTPLGPDWQYSLDQVNWQTSNIFTKAAGNVDFLIGNAYLVYCRNLVQNAFSQDVIIFGAQDNQFPPLDEVAKAGTTEQVGKTDQLLKLLGGLFLGNIPTTTLNYPHLVMGPDGKVWKKQATSLTQRAVIVTQYQEISAPSTAPIGVGIYRIVTAQASTTLSIVEGGTLQLQLQQQYSDQTWQTDTQSRSWSLVDALGGSTISASGLVTTPADSISTDGQMGVRAIVAGITVSATISVTNVFALLTSTVTAQFVEAAPTNNCSNSQLLTEAQATALPIVVIWQYESPVKMWPTLPRTLRPFWTREEATYYLERSGNATSDAPGAQFITARASSSSFEIGDIVYSNPKPAYILDQTYWRRPSPRAIWGALVEQPSASSAGSYVLVETDDCGVIIYRKKFTFTAS